ncbi:MAG TPA: hypothetical protein VJV79_32590 [Polyangiaceae bacterium]|nr:hypothetical protein [Polyangiaceae bacterium]
MDSSVIVGVAAVISWGVSMSLLIAFIVVIATVVRRHRPDASPILLGAMIFEASISLVSYATQVALPRFMSVGGGTSGSVSFVEAYALSNVIFSVAHAGARAFLLWGIVRLAQPPNQ